jgi:hypothetical protein
LRICEPCARTKLRPTLVARAYILVALGDLDPTEFERKLFRSLRFDEKFMVAHVVATRAADGIGDTVAELREYERVRYGE